MTIATYQISDADVGTTIGPQNGFVTGLTMLSPPTVFELPTGILVGNGSRAAISPFVARAT